MQDCPITGCTSRISLDLVMCRSHWAMVPHALKSAVWKAWRKVGDARGSVREQAREGHRRAKQDAIEYVNRQVKEAA